MKVGNVVLQTEDDKRGIIPLKVGGVYMNNSPDPILHPFTRAKI